MLNPDQSDLGPSNVAYGMMRESCFPWFGSAPTFSYDTVMGWRLSKTTVPLNATTNTDAYDVVAGTPCAVNTYNDVCAHTLLHNQQVGSNQTACRACKAGFHTDGRTGAWYCLPPFGYLMTSLVLRHAETNLLQWSTLWARRDTIAYEFECGYRPEHCWQCNATGNGGMLPDAFNQKMILNGLLASAPCASGNYCPHPLLPAAPCPSALPWSPPGSSAAGNCTCGRGSYQQGSVCVACSNVCGTGQYAKGYLACVGTDGAARAQCTPCSNLPAQYASYSGFGVERSDGSNVCPFLCDHGYVVTSSYTCAPVPQPYCPTLGCSTYSAEWSGLRDGLAGADTPDRFLSNAITRDKCTAACVSSCPSHSMVVRAATFDNDTLCSPCGAVPSYGWLDTVCVPHCNAGYFFNLSNCSSCAEVGNRVCPTGYSLAGQGCMGNSTVFSTSNLASNCVNCSSNLTAAGFYLDLTTCTRQACQSVFDTARFFWLTPCGGSDPGSLGSCHPNCDLNYYQTGACDSTGNAKVACRPCTASKPGQLLVQVCGTTTDSIWTPCAVGFYCDGQGGSQACPIGKTSLQGSSSDLDCHCAVGTNFDGSRCAAYACNDSSPTSVNVPGAVSWSSYYMALSAQMRTVCQPCQDGVSTTMNGQGGIGPSSCQCMNGKTLASHCQTGCSFTLKSQCTSGYYYSPACSSCACTAPPFASVSPTCDTLTGCTAGFDTTGSAGLTSALQSTGSSMYSTGGWSTVFVPDPSKLIQRMRTTNGDAAQQYVMWTIPDSFTIYSAPIMALPSTYDAYSYAGWSVFTSNDLWWSACNCTIHDFAVAKWPATGNAQVGALVVYANSTKTLFVKQVSLFAGITPTLVWNAGSVGWSVPSGCSAAVSVGHAYYNALSTFYVGCNGPSGAGVAMLTGPSGNLWQSLVSQPMLGMAVRDDGYIFMSFDDNTVKKWDPMLAAINDEYFMGPVTSLSFMWSSNPVLNGLSPAGGILTADNLERTFTAVQGMPAGSAPSVVSGPDGTLLAAYGPSIYLMPVSRCYDSQNVKAMYSDGVSCFQQACLRKRPCNPGSEVWNTAMARCDCASGYWPSATGCQLCSYDHYCVNGVQSGCPNSQTTSLVLGASAVTQCHCAYANYLGSNSLCQSCPAGSWCPNNWQSLQCPGAYSSTLSTAGAYPISCVCQAGHIGAACAACPDGFICTAGGPNVYNHAVNMLVSPIADAAAACRAMRQTLLAVFARWSIAYLQTEASLQQRLFCQYVSATDNSNDMLIVMIQVASSTDSDMVHNNGLITALNASQGLITSNGGNFAILSFVTPMTVTATIQGNAQTACLTGKVPTADGQSCQCAAGYQTSAALECAICGAGTYKAAAGNGNCLQCAPSSTSVAGSASCQSSLNASATGGGADSTTTTIIIAVSVGGGVLLLLFLAWAVQSSYAS